MKQVYHFRYSLGCPESNAEAFDSIYNSIITIKKFLIEKVDPESIGFFFTELGYESNSMDHWSIDSQDFKGKLESLVFSSENFFEEGEDKDIRLSFVFNSDNPEIWKYEFLDLSGEMDKTITVFGENFVFADVIYQMYDRGDYDTGMIAFNMELFEGLEQESYMKTESPDNFPMDEIFKIENYKV